MSTHDQTDPRGAQRYRPDTVDALASTVISVLSGRQVVSAEGLRQFVLDHLVRAILAKGAFSSDNLLAELRGYRLTVDAIIDLYVPTAARRLGVDWEEDRISFADVTIGVLRLQSLLSDASAASHVKPHPDASNLHALVLVPQGEQHFLGASVVAGQMRRMGCEVDMSFDEDMGALSARLMQDSPDLVLITCSRREALETVANTVQIVKKAVSEAPVLAVGGALKLKKEEVLERTGADIVTSVAEEAMSFCAKRIRSRSVS